MFSLFLVASDICFVKILNDSIILYITLAISLLPPNISWNAWLLVERILFIASTIFNKESNIKSLPPDLVISFFISDIALP